MTSDASRSTFMDHSIRSRLVYYPDGTRSETPAMGPDHFAALQILPEEIPPTLLPAAGCYLSHDLDPRFWASLERIRPHLGTLLWELHDNDIANRLTEVFARMAMVDIFSCNLAEGRALFGPVSPEDMLDALIRTGIAAVILRMGADGALVATPHARFRLTPPISPIVDVTGGGNSFSGGFLAGWLATSGDAAKSARRAAASAAHALAQFGPGHPIRRGDVDAWAAATILSPLALARRTS